MILKEIKLNNFISHENTTLTLGESEKILIDGRSGSGKSSITDAILWGLYGRGRTENRSLIRRGAKSASVFLKFSEGDREVAITRTVVSTGKNTLVVTQNVGTNKQFLPIERVGLKDTQDWIENEFLKASFELFTNSVAYPQENENSFVKATAARRKDLLLEIIHAGNFDELYDKTRKLITANELESAVAITKIENLESTIKSAEAIAGTLEQYKKEADEVTGKINVIDFSEKNLEKELNTISSIARTVTSLETNREMTISSIATIDKRLKEDSKLVEEHNSFDIETAKKNVQIGEALALETENIEKDLKECAEAQQKINAHLSNKPAVFDYTKDIEILKARLVPLTKDAGSCPAGDACPFTIPIKGQIDFLNEQIKEKTDRGVAEQANLAGWGKVYASLVPVKDTTELYKKLKDTRERANQLLTYKEQVNKWQAFGDIYNEIQERFKELDAKKKGYEVSLLEIVSEIERLKKDLKDLDVNKINLELSTLRVEKGKLQVIRDQALSNVTLAINAQRAIKDATEGLEGLKKGIKKVQEDNESLELLKEALSPRGIKAVVIDYLVPQLEERINNVLGQMSDFRIRLDTQKATVDEEGVKEGLFITVINDKKEELPFASYSGGEKVKITIAISEALASLMNQIGFRIMDENIVSLDSESTEGFVEVLTKLQERFPQLLVISHLQEVKDIFEKQIMVTKVDGISKVT